MRERDTQSVTRRRRAFAILSVLIGTLAPLLGAEILLRFLPVQKGINVAAVNAQAPVFHFLPNRNFVWSRDWDLVVSNRGRINNAGFVNDQDYQTGSSSPLMAVIGDSYVEAAMVPYADTLHGRLAADVEGRGDVYSFAASGAPLSQYLSSAEHAGRTYSADAMVFVVVGNDFDESLAKYKQGPGFHHYAEQQDGGLELRRYDYKPMAWVRFLLNSALERYSVYHLLPLERVRELLDIATQAEEPKFVGNTLARADAERLRHSRQAVDGLFRDLAKMSQLPPERILFVVDGLRYPDETATAQTVFDASYFGRMRQYLFGQARMRGYGVVDMGPIFAAHWRRHHHRFDYPPRDGHWNSLAHGLAAEAVMRSRLVTEVFGRQN